MFRLSVSAMTLALVVLVSTPLHASNNPIPERSAPATLSPQETTDLLFMREEEKMARDVYLTLNEAWGLAPFANIAASEQRHMDAMLKLLRTYRLADPAAGNLVGEFTNPNLQTPYLMLMNKGRLSALDALQVGGIIEETDIRDLVTASQRTTHGDIDATYDKLLCASRNHLRAFARSLEAMTGQPYAAQVATQAEVDVILEAPMERCGRR
ncbi:MAG: DUF2202 domain-containing protein [Polaromonas sp.]|uniref:DUF2202 domain-containing protein n=1 Tax=Polaromonas sp. TaxID=1869339 RepID=UPI002736547C|nr:DUF2202 domain-containing protein [Polaromonas sp.]MDP2820076.1 DUF2202 domain-containing protein [Polaromonas sp.]